MNTSKKKYNVRENIGGKSSFSLTLTDEELRLYVEVWLDATASSQRLVINIVDGKRQDDIITLEHDRDDVLTSLDDFLNTH